MLRDQRVELFTHPFKKGRVFIEMDGAMLADRMLHLACLSASATLRMAGHLFNKIGVKQFDRRYLRIDAQFNQVLVDQRCNLLPYPGKIDGIILEPFLGHSHQITQSPRWAAIAVRGSTRQDQVQAHQELLEIDLEVRPRLDPLHRVHRVVNDTHVIFWGGQRAGQECLDVMHTQTLKMLEQAAVAFFHDRQFGRQVFEPRLQIFRILIGIDFERRRQMPGKADIIDDETALFAMRHPVHARDGLEEVVLFQPLVDIHHLLNGRIKAGQQHVADDEEGDASVGLVVFVQIERLAEIFDCIPIARLAPGGSDFGGFVGGVRGNDDRHFQERDAPLGLRVGLPIQPLGQGFQAAVIQRARLDQRQSTNDHR